MARTSWWEHPPDQPVAPNHRRQIFLMMLCSFIVGNIFYGILSKSLPHGVPVFRISPWLQYQNSDSSESMDSSNEYWQYTAYTINRTFEGDPVVRSNFKGPADARVDATWHQYWDVWSFWVNENEALSSGQDLGAAWTVADTQQSSIDGRRYMVTMEGTHQLHCLYNLFRATHLDFYRDEKRYSEKHLRDWQDRLDHCIDILRQKLECDWDPQLITYSYDDIEDSLKPNFSVKHKCRDRHRLREIARRRKIE